MNAQMSTLSLTKKTDKPHTRVDLGEARSDAVHTERKPTAKLSLLNATALLYLEAALDKETQPLHPNFAATLGEKQLSMHTLIRAACAHTLEEKNPKLRAIQIGRHLRNDTTAFVTFWKDVMGSCAFSAHMEAGLHERTVSPDSIDDALDAMGDEHPITDDTPLFDASKPQAEREEYAGPSDGSTISDSLEDATEAVEGIQAWITLAFMKFTPNQLEYWGLLNGMPFGQGFHLEDGKKVYGPEDALLKFDAYRAWNTAQWKARNKVRTSPEVENLMADA